MEVEIKEKVEPVEKAATSVATPPTVEKSEPSADEIAPKKRRGRPPKAKVAAEATEETAPKKRRGRPPKAKAVETAPVEDKPKPRRGRKPKAVAAETLTASEEAPKKRGRKPKAKPSDQETVAGKRLSKRGQKAAPIEMGIEKMNHKELLVVLELANANAKGLTIAEIAVESFPHVERAKSNSWVRNSLRRLVRSGWVERLDAGRYRFNTAHSRELAKNAIKRLANYEQRTVLRLYKSGKRDRPIAGSMEAPLQ